MPLAVARGGSRIGELVDPTFPTLGCPPKERVLLLWAFPNSFASRTDSALAMTTCASCLENGSGECCDGRRHGMVAHSQSVSCVFTMPTSTTPWWLWLATHQATADLLLSDRGVIAVLQQTPYHQPGKEGRNGECGQHRLDPGTQNETS